MKSFFLLATLAIALVSMSFNGAEYSSALDEESSYTELSDTTKKKKKEKKEKKNGSLKERLLKGTQGFREAATGETQTEESKSSLTIREEAPEEEEEDEEEEK